nr:uncharacterized protein YpgQ isoform X2 [Setaria viridis]
MSGFGDGYVGMAQDAVKIRQLEKQREAERRKVEKLKNKSSDGQPGLLQFGSSTSEVELAALLHDIGDYKYTKNNVEDMSVVEKFLEEVGLEEWQKDEIVSIIKGMGFKNEVSKKSIFEPTIEFAIVQDADRLDAIGAIGIARCFTYGGSKNSALHDPRILPRDNLSKEKYMSKEEKQTSINHFHEKLFKLKDMMKTEAGKRRAEKRHKFMEDFVAEFYEEWSGRA